MGWKKRTFALTNITRWSFFVLTILGDIPRKTGLKEQIKNYSHNDDFVIIYIQSAMFL